MDSAPNAKNEDYGFSRETLLYRARKRGREANVPENNSGVDNQEKNPRIPERENGHMRKGES